MWFPMIRLVPGVVWDDAMANLGPDNPVIIKDGVQIFNGFWNSENPSRVKHELKYDPLRSEGWVRWLKSALEQEDFQIVQNSWKPKLTLLQRC